jgi:hypothetical protein
MFFSSILPFCIVPITPDSVTITPTNSITTLYINDFIFLAERAFARYTRGSQRAGLEEIERIGAKYYRERRKKKFIVIGES